MNYTNNPYMNPYMSNYQSPYMQPNIQQRPMQNQQNAQPIQPIQPIQQIGLQGKVVESIEVVKATDIPLDGSISYFALADGSGIVTKQLQMDGTSKMVVYRPTENEEVVKDTPKFITPEELDEKIKTIPDYEEDFKKIKRQINELADEISDINKNLKKKKED